MQIAVRHGQYPAASATQEWPSRLPLAITIIDAPLIPVAASVRIMGNQILAICPECGMDLGLPSETIGTIQTCPRCDDRFTPDTPTPNP